MSIKADQILSALSDKLGSSRRSGPNRSFNCPFCERNGLSPDTGRNLWVDIERKSCFQCFRCSEKGSLRTLMIFLGLTYDGRTTHVDDLPQYVSKPLFTWSEEEHTDPPIPGRTALLSNAFLLDPSKPSSTVPLSYLLSPPPEFTITFEGEPRTMETDG